MSQERQQGPAAQAVSLAAWILSRCAKRHLLVGALVVRKLIVGLVTAEEGEPEHDKAPLGHEVKQFRCFHCDEPGHTIRDCRAPGAQQARRDRRRGVTLEARSWKVEDATHKLVGGEGQ